LNEGDSVAEKKTGLKSGDERWIGETAVMADFFSDSAEQHEN